MSEVRVRPFRRADREQLTALVDAHIQAVVPGLSVSVNTVLSRLERDPGEFIVDPWVAERATLVAEQRGRVVAAADALMTACLAQLRRWEVTHWYADGSLPAPGVYGLPEQWPHIRALHERAGFVHDGPTEVVLLARVDRLLDYAWPNEEDRLALLRQVGFRELTRTTRGWVHRPGPAAV